MSIISLTDNSILQSPVAFYYSFFRDHASSTEPANFFLFFYIVMVTVLGAWRLLIA